MHFFIRVSSLPNGGTQSTVYRDTKKYKYVCHTSTLLAMFLLLLMLLLLLLLLLLMLLLLPLLLLLLLLPLLLLLLLPLARGVYSDSLDWAMTDCVEKAAACSVQPVQRAEHRTL